MTPLIAAAALLLTTHAAPAAQECRPFTVTFYSAEMFPNRTADGTSTWGALARGENLVAVDPHVIPLGSYVWIEGWGTARAADTGSAIKGTHVDWLLPTTWQANNEGVQEHIGCVLPPGEVS